MFRVPDANALEFSQDVVTHYAEVKCLSLHRSVGIVVVFSHMSNKVVAS